MYTIYIYIYINNTNTNDNDNRKIYISLSLGLYIQYVEGLNLGLYMILGRFPWSRTSSEVVVGLTLGLYTQ